MRSNIRDFSRHWIYGRDIGKYQWSLIRENTRRFGVLKDFSSFLSCHLAFQRAMDFILGDLRYKGILCYLDEVLIHSDTFSSHGGQTFERFRAANLTINLNKSTFFPRRLRYLGALIENGPLVPDPKRVEALQRISKPQTIKDMRRIFGLLGYYHAHIHHYAALLEPVFKLLRNTGKKKDAAIIWNDEHDKAIREAVSRLSQAVLSIPFETDEFLLETDASDVVIAGTLNVRRKEFWCPVEFHSRTLKGAERRWHVREREALAIVDALQHFCNGPFSALVTCLLPVTQSADV